MTQAQTIFPHLVIDGAAAALEFYKKALGATEVVRIPSEDGKRLMHAAIQVGSAQIYLRDDFPDFREQCGNGQVLPPKLLNGTAVSIHVQVPNCDEAMKRMVDAGAIIVMPAEDAFWGDRFGSVMDPFGHSWSFAHPLPGKQG